MPNVPERFADALATRYRIEDVLGRGGMATVFLAEDLRHRRPVAIKILSPEIAKVIGAERFLREIAIAARLNHPHIVPLFDSGEAAGQLYYVMPHVAGETLRAQLERTGPLDVGDALRIGCEIASALAYAHREGIVHRDIKPENVLLSDGIARVADFGIAHAAAFADGATMAVAKTAAGMILGTPRYMSPEQASGGAVDGRTDLYALACVLFEMLAGEPPFTAPTVDGLFRQHLSEPPRALGDLRPAVPAGIALAIARALAKDPDARFGSAAEFAHALTVGRLAGPAVTVATKRSGGTPNNLPREHSHFIGRVKELEQCEALLEDTRLMTLTGIGGSGKTRLALKLAERALERYPDGVWFIDLAPLSEPDRVAPTVTAVLGVREDPGTDLLDSLLGHLKEARTLIVLDNCEHVLEAAAALVDRLLAARGPLRIVATSREGFGIAGERVFPLRSLAVPAANAGSDPRSIAEIEAVRMFVDRAQAADPQFVLDASSAPAVAEICRRLDGIPLALALAAARIKILSVEQIRARLDDRFRLLAGGGRAALARHQTLHATIQWSYDQLSPDEQALLRLLAVFAGGWTLETATHIAGEPFDEFTMMDRLARLVDRSLVVVERTAGAAPRYAMLESVRQYAQERLAEAGEAPAARERHAEAFSALAERAYRERILREEESGAALAAELDNLRTALATLREADPERHLALAGALAWFWQAQSHLHEGREHVTAALAATAPGPPRPARARALWGAANLLSWQGDPAGATTIMEEAIRIWRALGDEAEVAFALEGMGWALLLAGHDQAACDKMEECVALQERRGDAHLVNRAKGGLGQILVALHQVERARRIAEEIVAFSTAHGDRRSEHFGHHYLADCALIERKYDEALARYKTSLTLAQAIGDRLETSFELQGVAMALSGLGEHAGAVRLAGAAQAEWDRLGADPHMRFWDALLEREIGGARRALPEDAAARAWAEGMALTFDESCRIALAAG